MRAPALLVPFMLLALVATAATVGCDHADAASEVAPVDESTQDVVSAFKLIGSYKDGRGRYTSLIFSQVSENGKKINRYKGKQVVQCATAPCPAVDVKGRWFARDGSLTLHPEGGQPAETYRVKVADRTLTLTNAQNVSVAELTKAIPTPGGIAEALAKRGVSQMNVEIAQAEIDRQGSAPGVKVPFASAIGAAVDLFVTDDGALRGTTQEFADDLREECGANADLVLCLANSPRTSVRLMKAGEGPPGEGDPSVDWVFEFFVDDFTDHGYYAVIDKKGKTAPFVYAFN